MHNRVQLLTLGIFPCQIFSATACLLSARSDRVRPRLYRRWSFQEDYCANRPANYLFSTTSGVNPIAGSLGLCEEGDCDSDNDCAANLIYNQHSGTMPVQGCEGEGKRGTDYFRLADPLGPITDTPSKSSATDVPTMRHALVI